jgi:hypothetical protein
MANYKEFIKDPFFYLLRSLFVFFSRKGLLKWMGDRTYLSILYFTYFKKYLNLKEPKTFNEKLQWLKIYDRKDFYNKMVDKLEARKYIENILGKDYVVPILGVWDKFEDIDFKSLPDQFVLKCNHDSGSTILVKNKREFNIKAYKKFYNKRLKINYYYEGREWPYNGIKPKIIAEKYIYDEKDKDFKDYKFMCFNGEPKILFIVSNRFSKGGIFVDFYDINFNPLEFERHYKRSGKLFSKPKNFDLMVSYSKMLSKEFTFVRIDWYEVNGKLYFSEFTLYPGGGFEEFKPDKWDYILGSWLDLSKLRDYGLSRKKNK